MRANFRADAIFQRRNDFSSCGVVLRIRREHQQHIERQPHRITLNLDVAFLHDVEKPHLNLSGKIWQLIDRENTAIRPRQQSIMNGQFVREVASTASRLDRINVANHVRNSHIRRGQLLDIAQITLDPHDRRSVAFTLHTLPA